MWSFSVLLRSLSIFIIPYKWQSCLHKTHWGWNTLLFPLENGLTRGVQAPTVQTAASSCLVDQTKACCPVTSAPCNKGRKLVLTKPGLVSTLSFTRNFNPKRQVCMEPYCTDDDEEEEKPHVQHRPGRGQQDTVQCRPGPCDHTCSQKQQWKPATLTAQLEVLQASASNKCNWAQMTWVLLQWEPRPLLGSKYFKF